MKASATTHQAGLAPASHTADKALPVAQADNRASTQQAVALQRAIAGSPRLVAQRATVAQLAAPRPNGTGVPDELKMGVMHLSGHSFDNVRVHYNSDKPAQLQARAYAQGSEIPLAPGQEKHLPHEAGQVAQQLDQAAQTVEGGSAETSQRQAEAKTIANESTPMPIQRETNNTGLPDNLKSGIENLSGLSMADVQVHYNSAKPAQLRAHAYAQGTDIYLNAGQEKHLPHEAWHVVQQKQGRVAPTIQLKGGVKVNDSARLEKEADVMGAKALINETKEVVLASSKTSSNTIQRVPILAKITGITHLVHALHGSIYHGTPGKELSDGTLIEVETSDKIRSRRGPNQEHFRHYDAQNAPEYRWVRVINADGEPQPPGTYVRDDTFTGGAAIPRGLPFVPAIDHRGRTQPGLPARTFAALHAPAWYERGLGYNPGLGHEKSSTADRKHAKLLAVAFGSRGEGLGPAMVAHAQDEHTEMALATVGQHMAHVAPWLPESAEWHGKDRHEDYKNSGEYFRTNTSHPLHQEYESYQKALGIYKNGVTTAPVNAGWANVALGFMGVENMRDYKKFHEGIRFREAQKPDRIARGPGAVIGNEEMAREIARMRHVVLTQISNSGEDSKNIRIAQIKLTSLQKELNERSKQKSDLEKEIATYPETKKELVQNIRSASADPKKALSIQMQQLQANELADKKRLKEINALLISIPQEIASIAMALEAKQEFYKIYSGSVVPGMEQARLQEPRTTDLRPLVATKSTRPQSIPNSFAGRLLRNRREVKLRHLFGDSVVGGVTDAGGREHPNLVLEKGEWQNKEQAGVYALHEGWKQSGLHTSLQVRGSFGHHRPSVSPLAGGRVRINPGLYPMSLLQIGIGYALGAEHGVRIDRREDFLHREALNVAVQHALAVVEADQEGNSAEIARIKVFAKQRLMINLLKAQTILKARWPDPQKGYEAYVEWLQNDFSKTSLVLENLNESTHLLLSARVNEQTAPGSRADEDPLLQPGPFRQFVDETFATGEKKARIYYVASGMQALTTGAIAAVAYRRTVKGQTTGRPAGFVALHPYFEMKGQTAEAAGFYSELLDKETIIADLSPVNTGASPEAPSQADVKAELQGKVRNDNTLVPVLDATAIPLDEVGAMVPAEAQNFIIVESLTKYAQLGSDKALGGRIIVVGSLAFITATAKVIEPVEEEADMVVSKIWFESMENMRYSH